MRFIAALFGALLTLAQPAAQTVDTGFAALRDARLFYAKAGAGPLMLLLHGAPDDWSLYAAQLREFAVDHLVVAPNLRGFPPSDAPGDVAAYTASRLLDDIHGLLDHFGRERAAAARNDARGASADAGDLGHAGHRAPPWPAERARCIPARCRGRENRRGRPLSDALASRSRQRENPRLPGTIECQIRAIGTNRSAVHGGSCASGIRERETGAPPERAGS